MVELKPPVDQLSWGEPGLPLLPTHWQHYLPNIEVTVPRLRGKEGAIQIHHLCSPYAWGVPLKKNGLPQKTQNELKWVAPFPNQVPIELAVSAFTQAGQDASFQDFDFIDTPILAGRIKRPDSVSYIPFLTTTWDLLLTHYKTVENIAEMLGTCSALEVLQTTQSISATLDVAITAPSWCHEGGNGYLEVHPARTPETIEEAYALAGARHLRTAGVDPRRSVPNSPWSIALASLAGIHSEGRATLEKAGEDLGVTRERVRQIRKNYFLGHQIRRQWPLGECLIGLKTLVDSAEGCSVEKLNKQLAPFSGKDDSFTWEKAIGLLSWYGHDLEVGLDASKTFQNKESGIWLPEGLTLEKIQKMAWETSSKTGFTRRPDLQQKLLVEYPGLSSGDCSAFIDTAFRGQQLPMGYLFVVSGKKNTVTGTFNRMLSWASPLHVSELREGLARRFRFRQLPAVPPIPVIAALIEYLPEFEIKNDFVTAKEPQIKDTTTIIGWIGELLENSPHGTLTRSMILDAARNGNLKQASVAIYLSFGETIKSVGRGCYALVGHSPTPIDIEAARHESSLIYVPDKMESAEIEGSNAHLVITVGTAMRDSGNISPNAQIRRLIGDRRFSISSHIGTHGHSRLSNGTIFFGFGPAFNALGVIPGDRVVIKLDFEKNIAHIELLLDED